MKVIIAGGGDTGVELAKALIREKHEVILIERDKGKVDQLAEKLDCLVIHGNAADPRVLEEAGVKEVDAVIAVTGNDHDNIIIALLARSIGVERVIVKVDDPSYNSLLSYIGVDEIVNPGKLVVSRILSYIESGGSSNIDVFQRSGVRFVVVRIPKKMVGKKVSELKIDEDKARIMLVYKKDDVVFIDKEYVLSEDDELLIACKPVYVEKIREIFSD